MKLETLIYKKGGWSKKFPKLDSENTLILLFASTNYINNRQPIMELAKHYPKSTMIGCSTSGEIAGSAILDDSISVAITRFEHTAVKVAQTAINNAEQSLQAGKIITEKLKAKDLKSIFVLSDGLNVNGSELVKGLNEARNGNGVNKELVITGGLAGDGDQFKRTWVVCNGEVLESHVVAVGLYGDKIEIGHGSQGGWDIFGPERRITRSKGNVLLELDGRPALDLYEEYLGERATGLPATGLLFPLAIRKNDDDTKELVRTILSVDHKERSLTFAGDMPTGYLAKLMHANFDRLISSAGKAGDHAMNKVLNNKNGNHPVLITSISCVGRRLLLGERTEEETSVLIEKMPSNFQQVGFYSYGEISPYATGDCDLHNQTMTITSFYENT